MEFYPRNAPTVQLGSSSRRRRGTIAIVIVTGGLLVAAAAAFGAPRLVGVMAERNQAVRVREAALASWESGDLPGTISICEAGLEKEPLDPVLLSLAGFSAFYRGVAQSDEEARIEDMDAAIFYLRKVLLVEDTPYRSRALYVLGKAYYRKGSAWYGEAVEALLAAVAAGFSAEDAWEHVALAYDGLGMGERAIEYFDRALAERRTDTLLLAAARARAGTGRHAEAEALAMEALSISGDAFVRELCRFFLGELLEARGATPEAESQYRTILEENPESAEAHYRLGVLAQNAGDPALARAEWRKAVSIDPVHAGARQKLAERP